MLSFKECRKIAEDYVATENAKSLAFCKRTNDPERFRKIALSEWSEASEFCFAFTYNSEKFLKTRNPLDSVAGQGPFIIDRRNGLLTETGSSVPKNYLENYEQRGDPYKDAGSAVLIYKAGGLTIPAIKVLRVHSALGLNGAKNAIEQVLDGKEITIDVGSNENADALVSDLAEIGFSAKRI